MLVVKVSTTTWTGQSEQTGRWIVCPALKDARLLSHDAPAFQAAHLNLGQLLLEYHMWKLRGLFGGRLNIRRITSMSEQIYLLSDSDMDFLCISETWKGGVLIQYMWKMAVVMSQWLTPSLCLLSVSLCVLNKYLSDRGTVLNTSSVQLNTQVIELLLCTELHTV